MKSVLSRLKSAMFGYSRTSLTFRGRKHLPLPRGPYSVACADVMTSFSKSGAFIRLFYPAEEIDVEERFLEWPPWIPSKHYINGSALWAGVPPKLYHAFQSLFIGNVYIPAVWQGCLLRSSSPLPVIVFSHGLSAWRNANSSLCLELASHGIVVAALEHRDSSACATFYLKQARMSSWGPYPGSYLDDLNELLDEKTKFGWTDTMDGRWEPKPLPQFLGPSPYTKEWIYYKKVEGGEEKTLRRKQLNKRAEECSQALDILESLNNGTLKTNLLDPAFRASRFKGRLDVQRAAVVGHSFGGATTILSLATELRFKVGVALDPWMFPFEENTSAFSFIQQPLLIVASDNFQDKSSLKLLKELVESSSNKCAALKIRKARHRDQCDVPFAVCMLGARLVRASWRKTAYRTHYLTSELIMEFLQKQLNINFAFQSLDSSVRKKYVADCFR